MLEVLVGVVCILIVGYLLYFQRPSNYPPGPWRLPVLGNLLSVGQAPFKTFIQWKSEYGPVVAVDFGSFPAVAVSDHKLVREVLNNPAAQGRPDLQPFLDRSGGTRRGILFSDGAQWTEQRRFTVRHLKEFGFAKKTSSSEKVTTEAIIQSEIQEWLQEFQADAGKPVAFKYRFNTAVLNVLWTLMTGERLKQDDLGVNKLLKQCMENMENHNGLATLGMFIPWLTKLVPKLSGYETMMADLLPALDFLQGFVDQHKATIHFGEPRDLIDAYLDKINETTDPNSSFYGKVGARSLLTVMLDLFFAGTESSSNTINWLFLYLVHNPPVQEKLLAEIDQVIGNSRYPALADREHMPYTEAVIQETLRRSSIAPLGIFRNTTDTMTIGNYTIPQDTMLFLNYFDAHHDVDYWGDPYTFRPERFLAEDGRTFVKHEAFMAFSAGKRACLGEKLALDELFIYITSIFQQYRIRADPENPEPSLEPVVSFLLSVQPHKLILEKRE